MTDLVLTLALAQVDRDYRFWHAWEGVPGTGLYARRVGSSPPRCVKAGSVPELREKIEEDVTRRNSRLGA